MADSILVINAGSSSVKFQLFATAGGEALRLRLRGQMEGVGVRPRLTARGDDGIACIDEDFPAAEIRKIPDALAKVVKLLQSQLGGSLPAAVGHRVVHGGPDYGAPAIVDDTVLEDLGRLESLAPLHQPNNLAAIRAIRLRYPDLPQVACFDTAFHRTHPEVAERYAIPEYLHAAGVRRYGFHGLSYEYIAGRLNEIAPDVATGRVIVAHLGSGASMCALVAGRSVDSTMGFTALGGLPMATRPGELDPGIVLHLMSRAQMSAEDIQMLLYTQCGLKALSGQSGDMRDLLTSPDPRARIALEYFVYKIGGFFAMLAAAMSGVDAFVFTAGIGENAPSIRTAVAARLAWLGLDLDEEANFAGRTLISSPSSPIPCYVIPTNEELMIARHTLRLLYGRPRGAAREGGR
jgi:acetate kinase